MQLKTLQRNWFAKRSGIGRILKGQFMGKDIDKQTKTRHISIDGDTPLIQGAGAVFTHKLTGLVTAKQHTRLSTVGCFRRPLGRPPLLCGNTNQCPANKRGTGLPKKTPWLDKYRQEVAAQKRTDVIAAARSILLNPKAVAPNVHDIAEKADVSSATLYKYFRSKESLIREVLAAEIRKTGNADTLLIHMAITSLKQTLGDGKLPSEVENFFEQIRTIGR